MISDFSLLQSPKLQENKSVVSSHLVCAVCHTSLSHIKQNSSFKWNPAQSPSSCPVCKTDQKTLLFVNGDGGNGFLWQNISPFQLQPWLETWKTHSCPLGCTKATPSKTTLPKMDHCQYPNPLTPWIFFPYIFSACLVFCLFAFA